MKKRSNRAIELTLVSLVTLMALLAALLPAPAYANLADDAPDSYIPAEVVVKLKSVSDLDAIKTAFNLTQLDQFGTRPIYRMQIDDEAQPPDKANDLLSDSRVVYAEPNYEFQAPESRARSKPGWAIGDGSGKNGVPWAPDVLRLSEAHALTRGAGVRVAVLDTGVDIAHPAFVGKLLAGYDFVDDDADPREQGTTDDYGYGHGTHVSGLVLLAAPDAKVLPVRVLDPDGAGNIWVLAEALAYAVDPDDDPETHDGAHIINLSLGTTRPTNLLEEILRAVTCENDDDDDDDHERCTLYGGPVIVVAAGNQGNDTPHYPAAESASGLIAVSASARGNMLASFSSFGSWVNVAAPGKEILSSVPGGGTGVWSGTSMAAPLTAGVAALMRARNPSLKAADITNLIPSKGAALCSSSLKQVDAAAALGLPQRGQLPCLVHVPIVNG